jgi:hypothetical protein
LLGCSPSVQSQGSRPIAELKTQQTEASITESNAQLEHPTRRADAQGLHERMARLSGEPAKLSKSCLSINKLDVLAARYD